MRRRLVCGKVERCDADGARGTVIRLGLDVAPPSLLRASRSRSAQVSRIGRCGRRSSPSHASAAAPAQLAAISVLRRLSISLASTLCALCGVLALSSASAEAKLVHVYSSSFSGSGASALSEPAGVAVNEETSDVYVVDKGHDRVEELNATGTVVLGEFNGATAPTGAFEDPEAIAVDNSGDPLDPSAGDVYVADVGHSAIDKFSATGAYLGQITKGAGGAALGRIYGVAVGTAGEVWVYQESPQEVVEIAEYSDGAVNELVTSHESQAGGVPEPGIAVDSLGDVYVVHRDRRIVAKLNDMGELLEESLEEFGGIEEEASGIAVDLATSDVYIAHAEVVSAFDANGSSLETFGAGHLTAPGALAVNYATSGTTSGDVYVAEPQDNDVVIFSQAIIPDVSVGSVSAFPSTTSATLTGTVDPDGTTVTGCEIEYGTEAGNLTHSAPCAPAVPYTGEEPVTVTATATGLTGGETYFYKFSATNANGTDQSSEGKFFQPKPVVVEGESSSFVEAKAATLEATVNPGGSATTYHFEVGSAVGSYSMTVPAVSGPTKPALTSITVLGRAKGLSPGTTYHFRVVAENALPGAVDGSDDSFTTLTPLGNGSPENCPNARLREEQPYADALPDCRAYEMVSPLEKANTGMAPALARAAVSGDAITYDSKGSFGEAAGAELDSRYVARRGASGWGTKNITPPYKAGGVEGFTPFDELLFTPELTKGVVASKETPLTETPEGYTNLYVANLEGGSYELLTPQPPGVKPFEGYAPTPFTAGASSDLSRVFFEDEAALTPEAPATYGYKVYESTGGQTSLVSIEPGGKPFSGEALLGRGRQYNGPDDALHAISEDGKRAFFTSEGQLYVRENPEQPQSPLGGKGECTVATDACTVEVSASQRAVADPHGPQPAQFWAANAQGTKVFFTSSAELTEDASTGPADNAANLYEYNLENGTLTDLTVDTKDADGAAVLGLAGNGIAEDGSHVYFVAQGALTEAANGEGVKPSGPLTTTGAFHGATATGTLANGSNVITSVSVTGGTMAIGDTLSASPYGLPGNATITAIDETAHTVTISGNADYSGSRSLTAASPEVTGVSGRFAVGQEVFGANIPSGTTVAQISAGTLTLSAGVSVAGTGSFTVASPNLYAYHDGEVKFIAALAYQDNADWSGTPVEANAARVSADGTHLAFISTLGLAGADNEEAAPGDCNHGTRELAGHCDEVYLYDASSEELACASCAPSGALPIGPSELGGRGEGSEEREKVIQKTYYMTRNLSEDGSRLFFQSPNALTQQGADGLLNVYEYEDGRAYPLSNVAGGHESYFLDASQSGNDVFIVTADPLVPGDVDELGDVYDVRVDGGFPAPAKSASCENAEACKGGATSQPQTSGSPASATLSGPGNLSGVAGTKAAAKPKALTRAQKLARALASCRKKRAKRRRAACERQARARYGAKSTSSKAKKVTANNGRTGR